MLLILGELIKTNLKIPFFGILTDRVTDIANIQNAVTFIKKEKQKAHLLTQQIYYSFLKLMQLMQKQDNCLINLISRLRLELNNFKKIASDGASVMTGVNNGLQHNCERTRIYPRC